MEEIPLHGASSGKSRFAEAASKSLNITTNNDVWTHPHDATRADPAQQMPHGKLLGLFKAYVSKTDGPRFTKRL